MSLSLAQKLVSSTAGLENVKLLKLVGKGLDGVVFETDDKLIIKIERRSNTHETNMLKKLSTLRPRFVPKLIYTVDKHLSPDESQNFQTTFFSFHF